MGYNKKQLERGLGMCCISSSKTTLTDYQCVSTGCCTHVAKTEITIDNQHVTKSIQRYKFLPKQPKENTEKNHKNDDFS